MKTIFFFSVKPGHNKRDSTRHPHPETTRGARDTHAHRSTATDYVCVFPSPYFETEAQTRQISPPLPPPPPPNLGGFDKDQNPNSETLHAMSLSHESQELLQFADAYVLIPFSMKRDPTPCAIKVMFLHGGCSPAGGGLGEGGGPVPGHPFSQRLSELLGGLLGPGEPLGGRRSAEGKR